MSTPKIITQVSLLEASGKTISRWATVLGDSKAAFKSELESFLRLIPEYKAMPAYLLLGMGDELPTGFEPTRKYLYDFYTKTDDQSAALMLENAGEFQCTKADELKEAVFIKIDSPSVIKLKKSIEKTERQIKSNMSEVGRLEREVDEILESNRSMSLTMIAEVAELESSSSVSVDVTSLINRATSIMPQFGFQHVQTRHNNDDNRYEIAFIVHGRKMYTAKNEDYKKGTMFSPFLFQMNIHGTGEVTLVHGINTTHSHNRCVHPHISRGICWGSGRVSHLEMNGKVEELLAKFDSMLRVYNSSSPYQSLLDYKRYLGPKGYVVNYPAQVHEFQSKVEDMNSKLTSVEIFGEMMLDYMKRYNPSLHDAVTTPLKKEKKYESIEIPF